MRTFLVAVVAANHDDVVSFLAASPLGPDNDGVVDSWWVAEDDRTDGSDNSYDSAIFVPRGSQADYASLRDQHMDAHAQEWQEDGYPYADTDTSGTWFHRNAEGEWTRTEPYTYRVES